MSKKFEFETTWTEESVHGRVNNSFDSEAFYLHLHSDGKFVEKLMIRPDRVHFKDLQPFLTKRTRVTIEVLE